jgi:signal peptidase I
MARSSVSHPDLKGSVPTPSTPATAKAESPQPPAPREGHRETVEAIVVAFILALLVRGFEAEAFVIPTGSMAPTLMGRHKEVTCPQCGYVYSVNASEEVEGVSAVTPTSRRVYTGICVNCRYQAVVKDEPSFKGDRILVMKFPYDLPFLPGSSGPQRWDVVVFRYPEEPEVSYIKRLVGLPGETLRIWGGNVFIKPPGGQEFRLARKPLTHQRAMQMMVYDDRHRAELLKDRPEWRRWTGKGTGAWVEDPSAPGTFRASAAGNDWAELRYHHLVPDPGQWRAIEAGDVPPRGPRPTLITDFYSYNTNLNEEHSNLSSETTHDQDSAWNQPHWVGDLSIACRVRTQGPTGAVRFELIEGGVSNLCEIDLTTGVTALSHAGTEIAHATTPIRGAGTHDVEFSNIDNRLTLLVDGRPAFEDGVVYEEDPEARSTPTDEDLEPVRVGVRGAKVDVSDLVLKRDIYYTLDPGRSDYGSAWDSRLPRSPTELFDLLADPARVASLGPLTTKDYPIGSDRFMMLGDNSPRSKDSRGWSHADRYQPADPDRGYPEQGWDPSGRETWEVPRTMLTGKAFCVYWPHGKPFGPRLHLGPDFVVPFRPYFERMKLIH